MARKEMEVKLIDRKKEFADKAADLAKAAYSAGWTAGIKRMEGVVLSDNVTPMTLLERFVELYGEVPLEGSMINPGMKLWRDYYVFSGDHMILTEDGWEPGSVRQSYIEMANLEGLPITDFILDEVNPPSSPSMPAPSGKIHTDLCGECGYDFATCECRKGVQVE
jgi:hypothetical protein